MAESKKLWNDHSEAEQASILENIAKVYEEAGHPEWLKDAQIIEQYVGDMLQRQQQIQAFVVIEASAPPGSEDAVKVIKDGLTSALSTVAKAQIQVSVSRGVGTQVGVIEGVNKVFEDGKTDVKHEAGQVLLLDFWATWCPPCQAPMAHNQQMLEKRGADWGDKVRLIGLSIDDSAATVKAHVEKNKWEKVEHYHVRNGTCNADDEYGVQGVPHVLLVDTNGKIVFVGHPSSRDLEKDIDALLKGETLTGEGTGATEAPKEGGEEKEVDQAELAKAKAKFIASQAHMVKNKECAHIANKLKRGFLVLVDEGTFNAKTKERKSKVAVHYQLFGSKKAIDDAKFLGEEIAKGPWEVHRMFREM